MAVIGNKIKKDVFGNVETPIGEFIDISGIPFKIVGVFKEMREREEENIFIPISTAQRTFNGGNRINNMSFTLPPVDNFDAAVAQAVNFKDDLKQYLQQTHTVAPDDTGAIEVWSAMEEAKRYYGLTNNIKLFFWFVGVCTIIAGVVGVSNIMMIVVKERTREIGIRKALGAKPWSIIAMILHEAIFVTAISGFGGLIFSMALLELVGPHIEVDYIMNPSVNFNVAFSTVIVLIVAGTLAGFVPAYRAAKVKVIESLRTNNLIDMFNKDRWREIIEVLTTNVWRTIFTAFGVCWGIFILIVLLAAGKGLENVSNRILGTLPPTPCLCGPVPPPRATRACPREDALSLR